ncbi:unannotated protein [freshwater metagenome]|uniref:Unannotated protein n=1 Tax=freshwater metagenome TaxID=449393 RepID=A0A6J6J0Y7_9ZZZZ|nr:hypothetical protein [Actinomycetota bacterium]
MNFEQADPAIKKLMAEYFDLMHFQDMSLFDKVFHKECVLYGAAGGVLNIRPFALYKEAVANRQSPHDAGNARNDQILMFDQISPNLALVKPQLEMFGGVMQDYLNIVFLDGQWIIISKLWEKVGDVA